MSETPILEPGREPYVAALFVSLDRPEVRRRVREGQLLLDVEGAKRQAIVVLEWGADGAFWLAWRLVGVGAQRVGVFHSEWNIREGVGLEALGEPFAEWADAAGQALAGVKAGPMAPAAPPEIAGQFGDLPQPAPVDATGSTRRRQTASARRERARRRVARRAWLERAARGGAQEGSV